MRILLISTYELGHQPLHVASPAAALVSLGHEVTCLDLSVEPWDPAHLDAVGAVGISVPMHTAMRLALRVAEAIRTVDPTLAICLYGLYAGTSHDATVGTLADRVISGEYEPALCEWVGSLDQSGVSGEADDAGAGGAGASGGPDAGGAQIVHLQRNRFNIPARHLLPPLDRYARLAVNGTQRLVGYVEASHGCGFSCKHCPVPTVYGGRIRIVGLDTVLADIDQLVEAGATHITFGDPDFLSGAQHSRRVISEMHARHPKLTFDCTTKVELVLKHRDLWPEFAAAGCLFVVSAFETTNDKILAILDKGHTRADMIEATRVLRASGIEVRPSLMPFTPWTTITDLVDLMDLVEEMDLVGNVDPVHYSIRLLVPEDSLLLDSPAMAPHLGDYLPEKLSYQWHPINEATDTLQHRIAEIVETAAAGDQPLAITYQQVRAEIRAAAGLGDEHCCVAQESIESAANRPRLTEAWFCCAEPTDLQFEPISHGSSTVAATSPQARSKDSFPRRGR